MIFIVVAELIMTRSDRTFSYFNQHLDKILFGIGFTYLILISGLLASQNRLVWPGVTRTQTIEPLSKTPSFNEDAKFIAYLQQSLKIIEQKDNSPTQLNSESSARLNVLPLSIQATTNTPLQTNPTVIERIYIPVYPTQTLPKPQYIPPFSKSTVTIPRQTVAPLPIPAKVIIPKPNIAPLITRTTPYNLVGVLDFGDRSSALFTENGLTQRIELGERIGSSGWTLTGIENQKAILFRQGKTRYLEVGQSF